MSVLSFHATKIFTTFEGAADISKNQTLKNRIDKLRNFFIHGNNSISDIGINGKMNEASAAMGLLQLKYLKNINKRKRIFKKYHSHFSKLEHIRCMHIPSNLDYNYSYFPIFLKRDSVSEKECFEFLLKIMLSAGGIGILTPLINQYIKMKKRDNALALSNSVICLPIYPDLSDSETNKIIKTIEENENSHNAALFISLLWLFSIN